MSNNPTEQATAEKTLLSHVEALIDAGTWILDLRNHTLTWSDGVYNMFGYKPQSFPVSLEKLAGMVHPDDRGRAMQHLTETIEKGTSYSITKKMLAADGSIRVIRSKATIKRDAKGRPQQLIGILHDITDLTTVKQQLVEARHTSRMLVENADGIFWEADALTFQFTYVSPQATQITGYTPEEWMSSPNFWAEHIHPDDREKAINYCHTETSRLNNHVFDYRFRTKSGMYKWLHDRVKVVAEKGEPVKITGLMIDVSTDYLYEELDAIEKRLLQDTLLQQKSLPAILSSYLLDLV